jgi:hypothetical protein
MTLLHINVQDKRLTDLEAVSITKMLLKRDKYIIEGRSREAHGVSAAINILWGVLTDGRRYSTGWGDL